MSQSFLSQKNLLDINISLISTPFKLIGLLKEWNFEWLIELQNSLVHLLKTILSLPDKSVQNIKLI